MENQQQYQLEPIQEEEEEEEEKDEEEEKIEQEVVDDQEEESPLKVWRPSRQSRSLDQSSAAQVEIYNLSVPYPNITQATSDLGEEITPTGFTLPRKHRAKADGEEDLVHLEVEPQLTINRRVKQTSRTRRRLSWSSSDEELPTPQRPQKRRWKDELPPPQKKGGARGRRKVPTAENFFPQWLVNLMHNIEEATTHELVVE
ncbi:nucleolar protein 12 [Salmo salar]|uniref:Nucleolar protein 12 n=1 Tax=Salmo salar TaxID=8030 RepID=A0A1S3LYJ8_SALSA|nr:nucleolar protein 12 [Salmo salar]|eukprot:XP_013995940.1 PREDICTED: nucleolar protein 12-like [Salmo salar]